MRSAEAPVKYAWLYSRPPTRFKSAVAVASCLSSSRACSNEADAEDAVNMTPVNSSNPDNSTCSYSKIADITNESKSHVNSNDNIGDCPETEHLAIVNSI